MPTYSRPLRLESFTPRLALAIAPALVLALAACDSGSHEATATTGQAQTGKADKTSPEAAMAKTSGEKTTPTAGANGQGANGQGAKNSAPVDDGCCKYCFVGTPCGDTCLPEGETCTTAEDSGCACTQDKRPIETFTKGWQPRPNSGLLGPDVFAYNAAQGDPIVGPFTLEMAFEGDPELADTTKGKLTAVFETSMGTFECELYEEKAPLTVANFVGLARGVRAYQDPRNRKSKDWVKGPYYDGSVFHRVIEGFMVQAGDPSGTGRGTPGYFIPDEFHPSLRHTGAGILSMANRNPYDQRTQKPRYDDKTGLTIGNTGSAQFFVTVTKTEALNDRHTIFGRCDSKVPLEISKVRVQSRPQPNKPIEDVSIDKLTFTRK